MHLTLDEKTFIIQNHKIFNSYTILKRKFCKHFNKKNAPTRNCVNDIISKFNKLGTVENQTSSGRKITVTTDEKVEEICTLMKDNLGMSVRRTASIAKVSPSTVQKIARSILQLYPYKIKILHELKPLDYGKRIQFATWFLSDSFIATKFIATDEAYFHLNGAVNNHNCRIWSDSDPNIIIQQPLKPEKVLVWCAVTSRKVIGPFFFDSTVNHSNYLDMLKNYFWPRCYRSNNMTNFYFQQDGAPAHRHNEV